MPLDIRPFNEEAKDETISPDARTNTFMDDLRARVAAEDEKQRQKWAKAAKPAAAKKPLKPARPDWLDTPKPEKSVTAATATRPTKNHKKKRAG